MDLATVGERLRRAERAYLATACEVARHPWGLAIRNGTFPRVHMGNLLYVDRWPAADDVPAFLAAADSWYAAVAVDHRTVVFHDPGEAYRLQKAFADAGFGARREVLMAHLGAGSCVKNPAVEVRDVADDPAGREAFDALRRAVTAEDGYAGETVRQLHALADVRQDALQARRFVGYLDGEPAGFVTLLAVEGVALVEALGTAPPYRNRGVGMTLTGEMTNRAHWAGHGLLGLTTDAYGVAKPMYERCGFVTVGEVRSFFRPGAEEA